VAASSVARTSREDTRVAWRPEYARRARRDRRLSRSPWKRTPLTDAAVGTSSNGFRRGRREGRHLLLEVPGAGSAALLRGELYAEERAGVRSATSSLRPRGRARGRRAYSARSRRTRRRSPTSTQPIRGTAPPAGRTGRCPAAVRYPSTRAVPSVSQRELVSPCRSALGYRLPALTRICAAARSGPLAAAASQFHSLRAPDATTGGSTAMSIRRNVGRSARAEPAERERERAHVAGA